jgi:hypothetical protein
MINPTTGYDDSADRCAICGAPADPRECESAYAECAECAAERRDVCAAGHSPAECGCAPLPHALYCTLEIGHSGAHVLGPVRTLPFSERCHYWRLLQAIGQWDRVGTVATDRDWAGSTCALCDEEIAAGDTVGHDVCCDEPGHQAVAHGRCIRRDQAVNQ